MSTTSQWNRLCSIVAQVPSCRDVEKKHSIVDAMKQLEFYAKIEELKLSISRFTNEAAGFQWTRDDYTEKLLLLWYHELQRLFALYRRPDDCADCNEHCDADRTLFCISHQLSLYGCVRHASVHDCSKQFVEENGRLLEKPRSCPLTRITKEHDYVCLFSGEVIGKYLTQAAIRSKDFASRSAGVRRSAGFTYVMGIKEQKETADRFDNADAVKRKRSDEAFVVKKLKRVGRLELTAEQINLMNTSYQVQRRSEQVKERARKWALQTAETVLEDVLYDKLARELLNTHRMNSVREKMDSSLMEYHYSCKRERVMPVFTDCVAIYINPLHSIKLLTLVERDPAQVRRFSERVVALWDICSRSPAKLLGQTKSCTLKQLAMAVLYRMKEGYSVSIGGNGNGDLERITIVPMDETLYVDLPDESELRCFGREKRDELLSHVTEGATKRGTGESQERSDASLLTELKRRKKRRRNASSFNSRRIDVPGLPLLTERDLTPPHLLDEALGNNSRYASRDITTGLAFLNACVSSFDESNRHVLAEIVKFA